MTYLGGASFLFLAQPSRAAIANPGFTGSISTPTFEIAEHGTMALSFSWLEGTHTYLRSPMTNRLYTVTAGILPGLEATLRLTEMVGWHDPTVPGVKFGNDRMFSAKYRIPLSSSLPAVAVGIQDIASANYLTGVSRTDPRQAYGHAFIYAVTGTDFQWGSWHLGFGSSQAFIQGFFGGTTFRVTRRLHLILEHDSRTINWGVRISPFDSLWLQVGRISDDTWALSSTFHFSL